jgi:hypothetical protein
MIKYQIISSTGIDVREKNDAVEALQDIRSVAEQHHLWLYLDGAPTSHASLTQDDLSKAQMIVLTHTILGG